jgi:hypothetical protein
MIQKIIFTDFRDLVPVLVFDPNPAAVDARVSFRPPHLRHLKQKRKEISKHLNQKNVS